MREERLELAGGCGQPPGKVFLQPLESATRDHRLVGGVALGRAHMPVRLEDRSLNGGSTLWTGAISVHGG
jgi:hypothetical protein